MNTDNLKKRCLYLLGMIICAGGYILVFYPPWQISMAYAFLALAIWVIIKNRKKCKINHKDIISIVVALIIFAICMSYILIKSWDTIKAVLNTAYPGSRVELGGGVTFDFFDYIMNIFLPFKDVLLKGNVCVKAHIFGLFPLNIIMGIFVMVKEKKKDVLLITSLIAYVFLATWITIGFPEIIAKITLMSKVQALRSMIATGFLDIIIIARTLALMKKPIKRIPSIIIAILLTGGMVLICKMFNRQYITIKMAIAMAIMCVYLFYFVLRYKAKYAKYLFTAGICFVMIMCGATVNPVRSGIKVVTESDTMKEIQRINAEDEGKWITENVGFPIANFILMSGVPVVNSTNTYPDMERWHKVDKEQKYEEVYNRYAHPTIKLIKNNDEVEEKFKLIQSDVFEVYLTTEELKELEIKYLVTTDNLEEYNKEGYEFNQISVINPYKIYKLSYN